MTSYFASPASLRMRELPGAVIAAWQQRQNPMLAPSNPILIADSSAQLSIMSPETLSNVTMVAATLLSGAGAAETRPDFIQLAGLVTEAVLEVVFVALPGFLVAITGLFDANSQKFVAELNTMVFTPCLIFTKLASQLNADKLADLVVIPFIFAAQTLVSYCCAQLMSRLFGFTGKSKRRQKNFVLAMGVFGNSNSLPISLVISLSKTISGLHWDRVPGDNDNEVAARGILYLLIFQQLGQLLRWTWGYSVLLKPAAAYEDEDRAEAAEASRAIEEGEHYRDDFDDEDDSTLGSNTKPAKGSDSEFTSGESTPDDRLTDTEDQAREPSPSGSEPTPANGNDPGMEPRNLPSPGGEHTLDGRPITERPTLFPRFSHIGGNGDEDLTSPASDAIRETRTWKAFFVRIQTIIILRLHRFGKGIHTFFANLFRAMPSPVQTVLRFIGSWAGGFLRGVWRQMNPPLWAMLVALLVASIPQLQAAFFTKGTFLSNSVTRAISQSGSVAVPLILVVLGANLARSTLPADQLATSPEDKAEERKLLYASLLSRMVLPIIIMAPLLALAAKFIPVSILDDPIFIVVCFLLTGAPSALQLAQICQINRVYMGAMSSLLLASYVFMIFPSTLLLVLLAMEVLQWAVFNH